MVSNARFQSNQTLYIWKFVSYQSFLPPYGPMPDYGEFNKEIKRRMKRKRSNRRKREKKRLII